MKTSKRVKSLTEKELKARLLEISKDKTLLKHLQTYLETAHWVYQEGFKTTNPHEIFEAYFELADIFLKADLIVLHLK